MKGKFLAAAALAVVLVVGFIAVVSRPRPASTGNSAAASAPPPGDDGATNADERDTRRDVLLDAPRARTAPAFSEGRWLNSEPLTLERLRGRVVVVDFWTFGCYNCRNTLPSLKRLDKTYRERGLTVDGVHSPEFDREKVLENLRREVGSLGIQYPVVTDNDYETWRAYGVEAWPTVVILDKQGRIRFTHVGEGLYDEQEEVVNKLLAEGT